MATEFVAYGGRAEATANVIEKLVAVLPVSQESTDDAAAMTAHVHEMFRRADLVRAGFPAFGQRCDLCARRLGCVWTLQAGPVRLLLGRECYRKATARRG